RSQRHGNSQRAVTLHAGADEKRDSGAHKSSEGSGKRKRAGAALCRILLRQPKRVQRKIPPAKSQEEKAREKPRQRRRAEIKDLSKREHDESEHQRKIKSQRAPAPEFFRKPRHGQAAENRGERNEHRCARSELCRLRANFSACFR